ncbi:MAG: hypothetical protein ACREI3_08625, partial [Nitrospirales bacterium]
GNTPVRSPSLGITFVVPSDWRGWVAPGSQLFQLDSARKPGWGLIFLLEDVTTSDLEARLSEPQAFEEAFVLDPTGPVERDGNRLRAFYRYGAQIGRALALLGPADRAVIFLWAGPQDQMTYYDRLLETLAASTQFASLEAAQTLERWYDRLSGMMLMRDSAPSAPFSDGPAPGEEWHLCADGSYYFFATPPAGSDPAGQGSGGNGFAKGSEGQEIGSGGFVISGQWRIEAEKGAARLVVTPRDSLPRTYTLRVDEDRTVLEGVPMRQRRSDRCV